LFNVKKSRLLHDPYSNQRKENGITEQTSKPEGFSNPPPLGYNMSGCSGGPVLMHGDRKGLHRWFIVAMVIRGPNGAGKGDAGVFDIITLRRIDAIQPNGKIKQDPVGWLP
ncbi:hypothetical protein, partial [Acetobacter farinalis]